MESWRVICPCQRHGGRRSLFRWAEQAKTSILNNRGAAVITLSLAVGGAWIPLKATTALESMSAPARPAVPVAPITVPFEGDIALGFPDDGEKLFAHLPSMHELITERVREEFFRAEIPYGALIYREAKAHNLSPELVAAVVKTESDFRPKLRSTKDARGLMQLIPSTGRLMGAEDLMEPTENVRAGARYLRYLNHRFGGDQRLVLAAYNAGEGNVRRFGGIPPFRETQDYLRRVATARQAYQRRVALKLATSIASGSHTLID